MVLSFPGKHKLHVFLIIALYGRKFTSIKVQLDSLKWRLKQCYYLLITIHETMIVSRKPEGILTHFLTSDMQLQT